MCSLLFFIVCLFIRLFILVYVYLFILVYIYLFIQQRKHREGVIKDCSMKSERSVME